LAELEWGEGSVEMAGEGEEEGRGGKRQETAKKTSHGSKLSKKRR